MGRPPHGIGEDALKPVIVLLPIRLIAWADGIGPSRSAVARKALEAYVKRLSKEKPKKTKD